MGEPWLFCFHGIEYPEDPVRRSWLLPWLILALACFKRNLDPGSGTVALDSLPVGLLDTAPAARELIPAEWTIAEDTAESGEVTTTSLQLPAAKDIEGFTPDESPRLLLRCIDGKLAAFIDTEVPDGPGARDSSSTPQPIAIQLDSAPACE